MHYSRSRQWRFMLYHALVSVTLVLGAAALSGCGGGGGGGGGTTPPPGLTDELIAAIENDSEEITALAQAAGLANYEQVAVQAERLGTVEWAQADGGTLTVQYRNGGKELWIEAAASEKPDVWPQAVVAQSSPPEAHTAERVGGSRAVLINSVAGDPEFDDHVPALMDEVERLLDSMGYDVHRMDGPGCSIEAMKTLHTAAVVAFFGHGGVHGSNAGPLLYDRTAIQTGQPWDPNLAKTSDWLRDNIMPVQVDWGQDRRSKRRFVAITDRFFTQYCTNAGKHFPHALFYSGACSGLKSDAMANALASCGVATYLGWTETTSKGAWTMLQFFRAMQAGMNAEAALGSLGDGLRTDSNPDSELQYRPTSGGSLQLTSPGQGVDPFRVTLTWQAQNDIDLHVFARPSSHSYYANKAITIGALDVDDVDGYGPEHFTADQRIAGTYYVAANYYSDRDTSAATPTYVQVETASTVKSYGPYTLQTENFNSGYPVRGSTNSWWRVCDIHVLSNGSVDVRSPDTSIPLGNYGYGGTYGVRHSAAGPRKDYEAIPVGIDPSLRPFMVPEGDSR